MIDEFEEIYRQSPSAKILEQSGLFANKSMNALSSPRIVYRPSQSLLEFNRPTVLLNKLTPSAWKRKSMLSPKDSMDEVKEFRSPCSTVLQSDGMNRTTGSMISNHRTKKIIENVKLNKTTSEVVAERMENNSRRFFNRTETHHGEQEVKRRKSCESNDGTSFVVSQSGGRDAHCKNVLLSMSWNEERYLMAEALSPDLIEQVKPKSVELSEKCKLRKFLVNHKTKRNPSTTKDNLNVTKQSGVITPVSSQGESDSIHGSDGFEGLVKNLFEMNGYTTCEDNTKGIPDEVKSPQHTIRKKRSTEVVVETRKTINNRTVNSATDAVCQTVCGTKAQVLQKVSTKPPIELRNWSLRTVQHKGLYVEGHRTGDPKGEFWHSSAIVKRVTAKQLETGSGSIYKLIGRIDALMTEEYGFSKSLVKKFQNGFPKNWKELIQAEQESKSDSLADETTPVVPKHHGKKSKKPANSETPVSTKPLAKSKTLVKSKTPANSKASANLKTPSSMDVTPVNNGRRKTSSSSKPSPLTSNELSCSSRGRLIKPPLAYWAGQRLRNLSVDLVEIIPGTSNLLGSTDSPTSLGIHETIQHSQRDIRMRKRMPSKAIKTKKVKKEFPDTDSDAKEISGVEENNVLDSKSRSKNSKEINVVQVEENSSKEILSKDTSTESDAISKLQSHQLNRSSSKLIIISSETEDEKTNESKIEPVRQAILERKPTSIQKNNKMMTPTSLERRLRRSSRVNGKVNKKQDSVKGPTYIDHSKNSLMISDQDADDEESDRDQIKKTKSTKDVVVSFGSALGQTKSTLGSDLGQMKSTLRSDLGQMKSTFGSDLGQKKSTQTKEHTVVSFKLPKNGSNAVANATCKPKNDKQLSIEECNEVWQAKEIKELHKAVTTVDPSSLRFWDKIAEIVSTKTAAECQTKYQACTERRKVTRQTTANKNNNEPVKLTATVGTMKRKRQLRHILEQHDEGYEDDLFHMLGNPSSKKPKIPNDVITDEDEVENSENIQTPAVRPMMTRIPKSSQKTPQSMLLSPGLFHSVDRQKIDPYIYRLKGKGRRGMRPTKVAKEPKKQDSKSFQSLLNGHTENIFDVVEVSDIDSEEEEDHYWSDEDFQ
ncbi:uncharacterized protein [Antedon mediterranea]|uniref:uncharacterized protein n=1 Tax=Antedon mediterranea TaxID=105859 RepID=UPI003AF5D083